MVKSIIKRIIVGVGIVLVLSMIKGTLIADVNAMSVVTRGTSNNVNIASCQNCGLIDSDLSGYTTGIHNTGAYIHFNVAIATSNNTGSYIGTLVLSRLTVDNTVYNCSINGLSNNNITSSQNPSLTQAIYSLTCPVQFKSAGQISHIYIQVNGSTPSYLSVYSPFTIVYDDGNQDIIDSINENSQNEIESQKVCNVYSKDNIKIDSKLLTSAGVESSSTNWGITSYIRLNSSSKITVKSTQSVNGNLCFYDNDKGLISCTSNSGLSVDSEITIPNNSSFVRFSINKSTNTPQFQVCSNGNQSVADSTNALNDTLNDDNISSGTNDSINSTLGSKTEQETFGPVADLILLPLTLFRAFYNGFNGSCSSFDLGTLFNTHLVLPCINLKNILGDSLYSIIDVAISLFMIYNIILMCIHIFDKITSFKDPFEQLFKPGGGF